MCGVVSSNPNLQQQNNVKVTLMTDSGSQSTACCVDFAKDYETDDSERGEAVSEN